MNNKNSSSKEPKLITAGVKGADCFIRHLSEWPGSLLRAK